MFYTLNVLQAGRWILLRESDDLEEIRDYLFEVVKLSMIIGDIPPFPGIVYKLMPGQIRSFDGNLYLILEKS